MELLKKHGLIDELDLLHLRGDRHYYETHGPGDHIHVACMGCGKVREFESRLYEQLKQQIARDFNMKVTVSRTEVGGYCEECLKIKSSGEWRVASKAVKNVGEGSDANRHFSQSFGGHFCTPWMTFAISTMSLRIPYNTTEGSGCKGISR